MIRKQVRPAIVMTIALCLITGFAYPGVVTVLARTVFPRQSSGSLVSVNGKVVGSVLIGQQFTKPWYFHSRPSAAGAGYDAAASSGTNKGPTDRKLADTLIAAAIDSVVAHDGAVRGRIPGDMVTSSASGLDPDISPANARLQVARVAAARAASAADVQSLVDAHTQERQFGFLGEPRVNVLLLNIALDSAFSARSTPRP